MKDGEEKDIFNLVHIVSKDFLGQAKNKKIKLQKLSDTKSGTHVTILVSGFMSEEESAIELWKDALNNNKSKHFYNLEWTAGINKEKLIEFTKVIA